MQMRGKSYRTVSFPLTILTRETSDNVENCEAWSRSEEERNKTNETNGKEERKSGAQLKNEVGDVGGGIKTEHKKV